MSCGAVVWRVTETGLELLLIKQFSHKDSWGIPKGHVYNDETLEQCATREVREETGVQVCLDVRLSNIMTHFRNEDKTVASWLAQPVGDHEPNHNDPDSEVADAKWFNILSLPRIHVYQRFLLVEAVSLLLKTRSNIYYDETIVFKQRSNDSETQNLREKMLNLLKEASNEKR
jgi:ADP-ribose pyrophosphatase YjhB (NUDIX family)